MASFLRTWLIRGAVLAVVAVAVFGVWTALHWVSPEKVRAALLTRLRTELDDSVQVSLGSAHMRLLGGLTITDLKLTRRGEPAPFLSIPHAILYHDKEKLNRGELEIRKIELTGTTIRLNRNTDGTWNLDGLTKSSPKDKSLPTLVAKDATVIVTDHRPDAPPAIAFRHVKLTVLNDPLPVVKFDGQCVAVVADALDADGQIPSGVFTMPLTVAARWQRTTGQLTVRLETGTLEIGPDLAPLFERLHPEAMKYAQRFTGKVAVKANLTLPGDPTRPTNYDVRIDLTEGRFEDSTTLPWPLDQLAGTVRLNDGKLTVEKMVGKLGPASVEVSLESQKNLLGGHSGMSMVVPGTPLVGPRWPPVILAHRLVSCTPTPEPDHPLKGIEDRMERFEFQVKALSLDDELFAKLTPSAQKIKEMFRPNGAVDVAVRFSRPEGGWRREVDISPRGLGIEYQHFRYPITDLSGHLRKVNASDGTDEFRVTVSATAGGKRLTINGTVAGDGPDPFVDLTIDGTGIPIDEQLVAALPPKYAQAVGKLRLTARGDFKITLKQELGVNLLENTFRVHLYSGTANYTHFPYSLQQVRGDLLVKTTAVNPSRPIRPGLPLSDSAPDRDRVELRNFEAVHDGGRLWVSGDSKAVPDSPDRKLTLHVQGENCPIDEEFKTALGVVKLDGVVRTFAPRGDLTFGSDIEVWDRRSPMAAPPPTPGKDEVVVASATSPGEPPFDPATDLKITFNFRGPSVTPTFFPYDLHQLSGVLFYQSGRVELLDFAGKHGTSTLKLGAADVRFNDGGVVWANLGKMELSPLVADAAFLKALPSQLRNGFEQLNVRGPAELTVKHMVISVPGEKNLPSQPPLRTGEGEMAANPDRKGRGGFSPPLQSEVLPVSYDRWRSASLGSLAADRLASVITLPPKAARPQPPDKPLRVTASGLLPFVLPWQKSVVPLPAMPPSSSTDNTPDPILYWHAILKLTGGAIDVGQPWDDVYGSVACEGRYESTHVGSVVGNAWLDRATIAGQPVTAAKVSYRVRPQQPDLKRPGQYFPPVIEFRDLKATTFGGTVGGEARVTLTDPVRYRLWLTASGVRLEDVAKHHKLGSGELRGLAQGDLLLENLPDPKTGKLTLSGSGQIDVPQGRMYNLPVLLELVKVLKGQTPDGVAFDEAHASFEWKGDRIKVTQLDLLGSAVSLGGSGELDTSGRDVKFEFYTIWSQTLRRWLSTPLGDVTGLLSGGLFKIELTRVNGELTPKAHMLPVVTDPARAVAERWRNRFHREPAVRAAPR